MKTETNNDNVQEESKNITKSISPLLQSKMKPLKQEKVLLETDFPLVEDNPLLNINCPKKVSNQNKLDWLQNKGNWKFCYRTAL